MDGISPMESIRRFMLAVVVCVLFASPLGAQEKDPPAPRRVPDIPGSEKVEETLSTLDEVEEKIRNQVSSLIGKATELISAKIQPGTGEAIIDSETAEEKTPLVYLLPIEGEVRPIMMTLFKRGLEEAKDNGVDLVLLEMDTPGGELRIAEEISRILLESDVPTATWIKNEGLSAGMLIAISTQKIFMKPVISVIGDCQPIFMTTGEVKEAPEKILTVVRKYGQRAATKNGYPLDAVLAMIDVNKTYTSEDGTVKNATGELLTLTADEAVHIGFASGFADSVDDILEHLDLSHAKIQPFEKNWAESLAAFIVSPSIASILTLIGLAGLFIEYKTPGFGVFGTVGIVFLALVFWGHSIAYLAGAEGILLFVLGMILLGVEIFLLPGFGLSGALGIGLIVAGLVVTFLDVPVFDPTFVPSIHLTRPVTMVGFALVGSIVLLIVVSRYLPEMSILSYLGISLATELKTDQGYSSHNTDRQRSYVGRIATVISPLKPSGIALLDGDRVDAVTEGDFVEVGSKVRVVKVDGFRIVVQPEQDKK